MHSTARQSLEGAIGHAFGVAPADAVAILGALQPCVLRGGEWLFRQGEVGDSLYLLARGRLQVWIGTPERGEAQESLVAEVAPGETVGEISLLTGGRRSASIRATRDSLLLRMDSAGLDRLGQERPQVVRQLAGGIAMRLRDRTAGTSGVRRGFRTIAVASPGGSGAGSALAGRLATALARHGSTELLSSRTLHSLGAPALPATHDETVSAAFTDWLADREDRHRFLLLVADSADSAWSRVTTRHADIVLQVADSADASAQRLLQESREAAVDGHGALRALVLQHAAGDGVIRGTAAWLDASGAGHHFHLRAGVEEDFERLVRILAGESLGLVLGGGAARGFAHLGVYKAFVEAGVPIDWVGGASIGAVMGAPIAMGRAPEEAIGLARRAFVGGKPFSDFTLPVLSLLRGKRMERLINMHLDGDIEDLPVPFYCISSNLGEGLAHVHTRGPLAPAVRASVSLPGVFPPAVVRGQLAIDGGILDNLPVDAMRRTPVGRIVAVDVTSRQDFTVDYDAVPSPWRVLAGRFLPFMPRYRVPRFLSLMLKATEIGTMAAVRASGERADLLLRPPVSRFSLTDVRSFDVIVQAGYEHARVELEQWLRRAGPA